MRVRRATADTRSTPVSLNSPLVLATDDGTSWHIFVGEMREYPSILRETMLMLSAQQAHCHDTIATIWEERIDEVYILTPKLERQFPTKH
jgi:hypothetical protein